MIHTLETDHLPAVREVRGDVSESGLRASCFKRSTIRQGSSHCNEELVSCALTTVVAMRNSRNLLNDNNEYIARLQISNAESDTRNLGSIVTTRPFPSASTATKHVITT